MTPQEALELLNNMEFAEKYQGKQEYADMLLLCKEALEKQIPQTPRKVVRTSCNSKTISEITKFNAYNPSDKKEVPEYKEYKYNDYLCPNCNALTKDGTPKYCWRCGQALDWTEDT